MFQRNNVSRFEQEFGEEMKYNIKKMRRILVNPDDKDKLERMKIEISKFYNSDDKAQSTRKVTIRADKSKTA